MYDAEQCLCANAKLCAKVCTDTELAGCTVQAMTSARKKENQHAHF